MTDEQRVDPRYDPAFQRGFEGEVSSAVRSRTAVRRTALVAPAPFRSAEPEPEVEENGVEDVAPTRSSADDEVEPLELVPVSRVNLRDFARNPFVVLLILLGGGMIVGGSVWANQGRQLVAARGGASTELDYWFLQATVVAAPLTILAGIGILAGVLFLAAGVWNRR
jgi:hypothetical protein